MTLADTIPWHEQNGTERAECNPRAKKSGSWVFRKNCSELEILAQNLSRHQRGQKWKRGLLGRQIRAYMWVFQGEGEFLSYRRGKKKKKKYIYTYIWSGERERMMFGHMRLIK